VSKITDLRRKATEASRARDWDTAVKLYERICDLEGSNPGYRNELGDVFAKMGDVSQAIVHFNKAVELYNAVGLNNNAVAVLKKILRYDPQNMDSYWMLGETRRKQGLGAEAGSYYLHFLDCHDEVGDQSRERFLDRCAMLLDVASSDLDILGKLDQLYEDWDRPSERARVYVCKAKLAQESGENDIVARYLERARSMTDELSSIPEYMEYFGSEPKEETEEESVREIEIPDDPKLIEIDEESGGDDDDSGEFSFQLDFDRPGESSKVEASKTDARNAAAKDKEEEQSLAMEGVNLLEEILADGDLDLAAAEKNQMDSIRQDLKGQIGGEVQPHDHQGHYELGLVYMDMGMFDQALPSFEQAAEGDKTKLKALEMQGNCLRKLGRLEEALAVYERGIGLQDSEPRNSLGILYEYAVCLETMDRLEESAESFERVLSVDEDFLDAQERLDALRSRL
jgi:tetratricopeptide (TPR) repeat protein